MKRTLSNLFTRSIFFVIPVVFFMLSVLIHFVNGNFFMSFVDPEYFHLFNGLNLSIFNLAVDFIHHPGTTIQVIFAVSARVVNILLPGSDLIINAMNYPEVFIHGANILLNLLTSSALLALGFYTYRYTQNVFLALLLQLMPFANYKLILISGRLIPETALIGPILILALLIVRYLYDKNREKNIKQYLVGFAVVGGLGIAGKLLYLPFLFIPFFLLTGLKYRLRYLAYTAVAIVIFAFPMFVHFGKSFEWVSNMFLHSGQWGAGDANVFDVNSAPDRLLKLYVSDKSFFFILALASLQLLVFYVVSFFKKLPGSALAMRTLLGVVLSIVISILMITKHFAPHYFIPTLAFKAFLIFLMAELFLGLTHSKKLSQVISAFALLLTVFFVFQQEEAFSTVIQTQQARAENLEERAFVLKNYDTKENPLIITSHYRGSPFVESGMVAGVLMSGHLKTTFLEDLRNIHPNTYFYYDWSDSFYFWDLFKNAGEFVRTEKPVYIFIGENQEKNLEPILKQIEKEFPGHQAQLTLLHHFAQPDEYFYELTFTEK
jgi:hypothetical protein